jgi:hypothetical protein
MVDRAVVERAHCKPRLRDPGTGEGDGYRGLGAGAAHHMRAMLLKMIFAAIVILLATRMLWSL